jgi:hypothetical protein
MREQTTVKPTLQPFAPTATGLLQRKCACGQHTTDQHGQCTACMKKGQLLQRRAVNNSGPEIARPIVHEVLRSPGRPLDPATRAYMEPRFGYDFSQVRIHTDPKAAESARVVNALAYTVGHHVAFDSGQYAPTKSAGRRLLAHELAHVVQQFGKVNTGHLEIYQDTVKQERQAKCASEQALSPKSNITPISALGLTAVQRFSSPASSESGSSQLPDVQELYVADKGPGGECLSAKIDVRATHIGALGRLPIYHLFIVYQDQEDKEWYFRGGPGNDCTGGDYGGIETAHGPYTSGTVDWDPSAPSETVISGQDACGKDICFRTELGRIQATCTTYESTGPNSNTVARTLLAKCDVPQSKPVWIAPGWENDLL